jgi:hypothetical protein
MLDRPNHTECRRLAARQREARSRRRRKVGKLIIGVEVDEAELIEALVAAGRLCEADTGSRAKLTAAFQTVAIDFITRWTR